MRWTDSFHICLQSESYIFLFCLLIFYSIDGCKSMLTFPVLYYLRYVFCRYKRFNASSSLSWARLEKIGNRSRAHLLMRKFVYCCHGNFMHMLDVILKWFVTLSFFDKRLNMLRSYLLQYSINVLNINIANPSIIVKVI